VKFFHKNEYVRSYSIYKHDTTLKMTFGANFFLDDFNSGPPTLEPDTSILKKPNFPPIIDDFNYVLPQFQAHVNPSCIQTRILMWLASWGGHFSPNVVRGLYCLASGTLLYNQHNTNRHNQHNTTCTHNTQHTTHNQTRWAAALGWEIRLEFRGIQRLIRFRTFWTPEFSSEIYFSDR
jgi:hypothetical protein